MTAPVNEQIKAKAASSLLERLSEKTKLVRLFRRNAAMKHGVPLDDEGDINIIPDDSPPKEQPQQPSQNVVQIVKTDECDKSARERALEAELERLRQSQKTGTADGTGQNDGQKAGGLSDKLKGALQTLAVLGGLGAAGYAGSQLGKTDNPTPPKDEIKVTAPLYSPYQYLEDTGEHLP